MAGAGARVLRAGVLLLEGGGAIAAGRGDPRRGARPRGSESERGVTEGGRRRRQVLIDAIVWAIKHRERNIADAGLSILLEMLRNLDGAGEVRGRRAGRRRSDSYNGIVSRTMAFSVVTGAGGVSSFHHRGVNVDGPRATMGDAGACLGRRWRGSFTCSLR